MIMENIVKRVSLLVLFIVVGISVINVYATTTSIIIYRYDRNGNRVARVFQVDPGAGTHVGARSAVMNDSLGSTIEKEKERYFETLEEQISYRLYPNPTKGVLKFVVEPFDETTQAAEYFVTNNVGQIIIPKQKFTGVAFIDITNENVGVYVLCLKVNGKEMIWKIMKQ